MQVPLTPVSDGRTGLPDREMPGLLDRAPESRKNDREAGRQPVRRRTERSTRMDLSKLFKMVSPAKHDHRGRGSSDDHRRRRHSSSDHRRRRSSSDHRRRRSSSDGRYRRRRSHS
ncbi:hypothetical protein GCM10023222_10010 [Saccharopolyspora cebuensis]